MPTLDSIFNRAFLGLLIVALGSNLSAKTADVVEDIRPAKEVIVIPKTFSDILKENNSTIILCSGIGIGVVLVAIALFFWRRHYLIRQLDSPKRIALLALRELEADQEGIGAEAFAYLTSKIVRQYIADRFSIAAPRRTTEEFLDDVARDAPSGLLGESEHLRTFLKSCDLAKFADSELDTGQRNELVTAARNFVNSTSKAIPA